MEKLEKFEIKEVSTLKVQTVFEKPIIRTAGMIMKPPKFPIDDIIIK
ncbi:hypothetical protein [[Clostridium] polysaccharolyticum]|jgi:hypothetical protein|uniref:Uncharacterized protein n=1 Tax=[Clostridium] polysaccharolyticum TaxID=29364 RepID=A0A1H9ZCJ1_9FIRM|nr:hypothetical protein [[Clostridium] polysaccharolyticum]SES78776.1 hypothetical protein SAMN04487772_103106 [[Clostridium] polysaccharolyticum]